MLVILPYAFPAYLTGLVWAGMLNQEFGFINEVLLGGAQIPWLADPWLARFSVHLRQHVARLRLHVPGVHRRAAVACPTTSSRRPRWTAPARGASFRAVKLPLLFVAVAPLLIATFAFNFNNFGVIYMLTRGNPRFTDTTLDIGATDIMITMVYKVAFGGGGGRDLGLASALSILIFVIVTIVAVVSFRQTKALEDLN